MKREPKKALGLGVKWNRLEFARVRSAAAFSLIELMVVVLIIVALSAMYWGGASGNSQHAKAAACQQNLQKLHIAMQIYANEHNGEFPATSGARTSEQALDVLVPKYSADTSLFICPASEDFPLPSGESLLKRHISYSYYMGHKVADLQSVLMSDEQVDAQSKLPGQPVFSTTGKPPGNNHKKSGGNFLFCDGHVDSTVPTASFSLVLTQGVVLLNPLPR